MKWRIVYLLTLLLLVPMVWNWNASQAQAEKKPKDREEYDLIMNSNKETDPTKKIAILDQWKQKYAQTDYQQERWAAYMQAYQQANQPARALEAAKEILKLSPKDFSAHLLIASVVPFMGQNTPQLIADAKAAGQALANPEKPAGADEAAWANAQKAAGFYGPLALGWAAMQEKQNDVAEQEFVKVIKANPQFAQASLWLGTVVQAQKNPDKNTLALFSFARAATYDGPGALPPQSRQQMDAYITKTYTSYHGEDPAGLAELKKVARANALPPSDLRIRSKEEIEAQKFQELQANDPQLALFVSIKQQLTDQGDAFFQSMKGTSMPKFKGTVLSTTPAARPKTLTLGISQPSQAEVTLTLEEPLPRAVPNGTVIEFEGAEPVEYSASPFMLKLNGGKIVSGLPQAPAATKKAGAKKAAPKKAK
jgi:tetratricopeptide (TPR) repeat protein